jgi:hypothetical protein
VIEMKKSFIVVCTLLCFCLAACVGEDVLNEVVEDSATVSENYVELDETVNNEELYSSTNEATECQETNYPQDEQPVIALECTRNNKCPVCEMLYIDGEYLHRCDLRQKYTFFFYLDFNRWNEWDGIIIDNWWLPEDTRPATNQRSSSDWGLGMFVVQNDRIILEENDGSMGRDEHGMPTPPRFVRELTTTQWDEWGVQIFQYAGDVTLIGKEGTLSQMPELHEDDFRVDFCEEQTIGREIVYIFYHELPESKLWNRLMYPNQ